MGDQVIHNVLHVPKFKFNVLSVSKLTRELSCGVAFFPDFCILQALSNGKVMGIGKEREGLYILKECITSPTSDTSTNLSTKISRSVEDTLWHCRLRHPSCDALQHISSLPRKVHSHVHETCDICPLSKQHRLQLRNSTTKTIACFDFVHLDVWGTYKSPTYDMKHHFVTLVDNYSIYSA